MSKSALILNFTEYINTICSFVKMYSYLNTKDYKMHKALLKHNIQIFVVHVVKNFYIK